MNIIILFTVISKVNTPQITLSIGMHSGKAMNGYLVRPFAQ